MKPIYLITLPLLALPACGGSSSNTPTFVLVAAASESVGDSDVAVETTPSGDIITLIKSDGPRALPTDTAPDVGTFKTAFESVGSDYSIAFVNTTEGSAAGGAVFDDAPSDTHGVFYERLGTTNIPTEGSATYNGDYVGMLVSPSTSGSIFGIGFTGQAELNVDFADNTVEGTITDRELVLMNDYTSVADSTVSDMTLVATSLTETGTFSGNVTGGEYTSGGSTTTVEAESSYEGLIAGATAHEAVGAVSATHLLDGNSTREIGAFSTGQD